MAFNLAFDDNSKAVLGRLTDMKKRLKSREKGIKACAEYCFASIKKGYAKQRAPDGEPWKPLDPGNPNYQYRPGRDGVADLANEKMRVKAGDKALLNNSLLITSLTWAMDSWGESARIGYGTPQMAKIAKIHQFGLESIYKYKTKKRGLLRKRTMTPTPRPNLGFARTWTRHGTTNDYQACVELLAKFVHGEVVSIYG